MSRSELTPAELGELAALDEILAGEPVSDDHLELAALVDSVRSVSPGLDEDARARLDARLVHGVPPRSRRAGHRSVRPSLAWAGGSLAALAIAAAAILGGGALSTGSRPSRAVPGPAVLAPSELHSQASANGATRTAPPLAKATPTLGPAYGATSATGVSVTPRPSGLVVRNVNPAHRLVARGASLTIASPPDRMQDVANEIVASTERLGGIVESSSVEVQGASSYATFSLSVPSPRLPALISSLSSLAAVRSLSQSTLDLTDSYDGASAQLAEERSRRPALIAALAGATSLAQQDAIQAKINALDAAIAAATRHVGALLSRGHNASVSVQIVAGASGAALGGSGPVDRALADALRVLNVALAIALVASAIVIPLAFVGFAFWWSAATLRQRGRERMLVASSTKQ